ncbi:hypothetical protein HC928_20365 [bacterium]|nr:hypothetical protein [bacterium]
MEYLTRPEMMKWYVQNGNLTSPRFSTSADPEVQAMSRVELQSPVVVRLDGTNAEEGRAILSEHLSDMLQMQPDMLSAAQTAVAIAAERSK